MELDFDYSRDRQFYVLRFIPGEFESAPFIRELRFWGVDRVPCPRLSTLAALIALRNHPVISLTIKEGAVNPPVCTALSNHFGVEIHPANYDINQRDLAGGDRIVAPVRFSRLDGKRSAPEGAEVLSWTSLDDLRGPFGGLIRTNLDAFQLTELEKDLIVALCSGGKDVGHIVLEESDTDMSKLLHLIGLEYVKA